MSESQWIFNIFLGALNFFGKAKLLNLVLLVFVVEILNIMGRFRVLLLLSIWSIWGFSKSTLSSSSYRCLPTTFVQSINQSCFSENFCVSVSVKLSLLPISQHMIVGTRACFLRVDWSNTQSVTPTGRLFLKNCVKRKEEQNYGHSHTILDLLQPIKLHCWKQIIWYVQESRPSFETYLWGIRVLLSSDSWHSEHNKMPRW